MRNDAGRLICSYPLVETAAMALTQREDRMPGDLENPERWQDCLGFECRKRA